MTIQEAQQQLRLKLATIYDDREATTIADWVMEHLTGWKKVDRLLHKQAILEEDGQQKLEKYSNELLAHKPVQYVLNETWFCGMKLYVNENVLIPRPETEELVQWIISEHKDRPHKDILDVGTGSGCIAVALKKNLPGADVTGCDVSERALEVASENRYKHETNVTLMEADFLDTKDWITLPWNLDILVSNPPYVPLKDKDTMNPNVLNYEPHVALFVENNDPLVFYKALAEFALKYVKQNGAVYAEIHEDLGDEVRELFTAKGFASVEMRKDMQGKERMVKAVRS